VTLDEDHLCQLLTNLCINAKHAIQSKGLPPYSRITCAFRSVDGLLLLSVTDNGIGMDPALVGSIFEPFFTTKRTGEGSGLGLAIVLKIVDDYHGQIDVVSKLGQGTEFKLKLPVLYGQSPQPLTL
uniref:sensor histidine kinase n=1 Tax=Marinobacter sediminum TaxID=256323 RepID=UPI0035691535